jgi:uncharacterized protein (TIGR03000 family)
MTTTTGPSWGHHGYGGYSGYAGYSCYAGYACNGCFGCYGCGGTVQGYGFAGGCYGYHGGCYGGWGIYTGEYYCYRSCTGCYGCYGGYSCYGIPTYGPVTVDPFPPINPKTPEVVPQPGEKKKETSKKDENQVRAIVRIEIPAGGKLFVDGNFINVAPGTSLFQTPALARGETYYYDIRIEVDRQGAIQSEERRVIIRSGEDIAVNFPNLRPTATQTVLGNK